MFKLDAAREPYWLGEVDGKKFPVDGIRLKVKPIGEVARRLASSAGAVAYVQFQDDEPMVYGGVAYTLRMAQWGIVEWEGVGDASGEPVAPTPERIGLLMETSHAVFEAVDDLYVGPALLRDAEKNASSGMPNGGSGKTAINTAPPAKPRAKRARSSSTNRKPTKPGKSGAS